MCLSASGAAACDISIGDTGFNIGMASNKATETWTRSYAVSAGGTFEVENTNGLVEVLQGTGPKVEVSAEKIAKASSDEAAKDLLSKIEIVETVKPESVRLVTKTPKSFGSGGAEVKYTIKVPAGLRVRAGTTNGGIKLTGISNDVEASTTNGGVNGEDLSGTIDASTTNGGVHLARLEARLRRSEGRDDQRRRQRLAADRHEGDHLGARDQRRTRASRT